MFKNLLSKFTTTRFRSVAGSDAGVFAVDTDGILYSWSDYGSFLGRSGTEYIPTQVPHLTNVKSVACYSQTIVALMDNGTLYAWGRYVKDLTQVEGIEEDAIISEPTLVKTIADVDEIAVSNERFLFLKKDGTVWAVGKNREFSLGTGCAGDVAIPARIPNLEHISQVALSEKAGIAVSEDGIVYTWGEVVEALGQENETKKTIPFPVKDLSSVTKVAVEGHYFLALTIDGSVYEWGIHPASSSYRPDYLPMKKLDLPPCQGYCSL
ncbi:hypothetical protein GEMRC1_002657 [Eukaryota sp. GEM-RC1]